MSKLRDVMQNFQAVADHEPELLKAFYPRRYREVKGFPDSPRVYASALCNTAAHMVLGTAEKNPTMQVAYSIGNMLVDLKVPTYFLAPDVLEALLATDAPLDITLAELKMPTPAFLLCLPFIVRDYCPSGFTIYSIAVGLMQPGHRITPTYQVMGRPARQFDVANTQPTFMVHALAGEPDGLIVDHNFQLPINHALAELSKEDFNYYPLTPGFENKYSAQDYAMQRLLASIVLQVLLLFNAEPKAFEEKKLLTPPVRHTHGGKVSTTPGVWDPNFIGRNYKRVATAPKGGTHATPSTHVRRAHWHTYWVGKGRTERKLNWVQWTFVNL